MITRYSGTKTFFVGIAVCLLLCIHICFGNSNWSSYKRAAEPSVGEIPHQNKLADHVLTHYLQRRLSLQKNQMNALPSSQQTMKYLPITVAAATGNFLPTNEDEFGDKSKYSRIPLLDVNNSLNDFQVQSPDDEQGECSNCADDSYNTNRWTMPLLKSGEKKYYLGIFFKANWYRSAQYCRYHGMNLASISNQEENDKLEKHVTEYGLGHEHFWTSGTDLAEEGSFFWLANGRPIVFSNWNTGEPNNFRYENGEEEHCLELWNRDGKGLKWNDSPCSFETYFICEM